MAVIINEFEVVTEPSAEPTSGEMGVENAEPSALSPGDIERVQRYLLERRLRLLAD